jgi:hypothetical protein
LAISEDLEPYLSISDALLASASLKSLYQDTSTLEGKIDLLNSECSGLISACNNLFITIFHSNLTHKKQIPLNLRMRSYIAGRGIGQWTNMTRCAVYIRHAHAKSEFSTSFRWQNFILQFFLLIK